MSTADLADLQERTAELWFELVAEIQAEEEPVAQWAA